MTPKALICETASLAHVATTYNNRVIMIHERRFFFTSAFSALAICTAILPTPPVAPKMQTLFPFPPPREDIAPAKPPNCPDRNNPDQAVNPAYKTAAASESSSFCGL